MFKKMVAVLTAVLLLLPFTPVLAQEVSVPETMEQALQAVYDEERYAQAMYEGLADKFGDGPFSMLIRAEGHHMLAVERVAERNGIALTENEVDVTIPETREEGVQMAIDYETNDVLWLESLLAKDYAPQMNRMLSNLLRGSQRHEWHMIDYAEALADGRAENWMPNGTADWGFCMGNRGGRWMNDDTEGFGMNRGNRAFGSGRASDDFGRNANRRGMCR